jgi:hypothetical protein
VEARRCTECNELFDSNWGGSFCEVCQNCTSAGTLAQTSGAPVIHEDNGIGESVNDPSSLEGRATWDGTQWVREQGAPRVGQIANWDGTQWVIADREGPSSDWEQRNPASAQISNSTSTPPKSSSGVRPRSKAARWILTGVLGILALIVVMVVVVATLHFINAPSAGKDSPGPVPVSAQTQTRAISGSFTLLDAGEHGILHTGSWCTGTGGYGDIGQGTQVVVKDGSSKYLASTVLGAGTYSTGSCSFSFTVTLTQGEDAYAVSVSHRGEIFFTWNQLVSSGPQLSLGG